MHGTHEYPFVITERGIVVLPVTSAQLDQAAPVERVLTGIPALDQMLGGGLYRGSSLLLGGEAGTGKTALAAKMLEAACARGERGLLVSLEESPAQLFRNMSSVGIDLERWVDQGLLRIWAARPSAYGLEMHLVMFLQQVEEFAPSIVALDAMASLNANVASLVVRKIDYLKRRGITTVVTSLLHPGLGEMTNVSSLMDTWILVRNAQTNGEQHRLLSVRKSRGTAHSHKMRELVVSETGFDLLDVPVRTIGAVVGSAQLASRAEQTVAARRRGPQSAVVTTDDDDGARSTA
jgi:circadian clock protein KaiC